MGHEEGSHSSILAWRIPWTEEPGGLQSIGSQRIRHDWSDWACVQAWEFKPWRWPSSLLTLHLQVIGKLHLRHNLLLLLSHFSCVQLCETPEMAAHQAPPSLGFSRQEHWSGLPVPSPMHESEKWKWSHSVVSHLQWSHGLRPTRLLCPWDFPGKSNGVGCHCLLWFFHN